MQETLLRPPRRKLDSCDVFVRRLTPAVLQDIYLHCTRPRLEFANIVWSGLTTSDSHRLEQVNRKAARVICGLAPRSEISHALVFARAGL